MAWFSLDCIQKAVPTAVGYVLPRCITFAFLLACRINFCDPIGRRYAGCGCFGRHSEAARRRHERGNEGTGQEYQ